MNAYDANKATALFYAVEAGMDDSVNQIIKAGADVNQSYSRNKVPLVTAAGKGYSQILNILMKARA